MKDERVPWWIKYGDFSLPPRFCPRPSIGFSSLSCPSSVLSCSEDTGHLNLHVRGHPLFSAKDKSQALPIAFPWVDPADISNLIPDYSFTCSNTLWPHRASFISSNVIGLSCPRALAQATSLAQNTLCPTVSIANFFMSFSCKLKSHLVKETFPDYSTKVSPPSHSFFYWCFFF